jgi:hypothetical protein
MVEQRKLEDQSCPILYLESAGFLIAFLYF